MERNDWTQIRPSLHPRAREGAALVFDSLRGRSILFGGHFVDQFFDDTWAWDGTNWTQIETLGPNSRHSHGMAYDEARDRVVVYGGFASNIGFADDTWEFDGASWSPLSTGLRPGRRWNHGMAYDSSRRRVVTFGGEWGGFQSFVLEGVWELGNWR